MKKKISLFVGYPFLRIAAVGVIALLVCIIVALLLYISTLTSHVATLETNEAEAKTQLSAYQNTRCATAASVTEANTLTRYSVESAGYTRTYSVHTPKTYDPNLRYPVILSFDGISGSGSRIESYSGLDGLPAIVVYPDSLPGKQHFTAWQGAPYSLDGEYDIEFVRAILQILPSQYCTDSNRAFAVGMSNGGGFATIVGCEFGDQIRAVASVSGAYYTTCQQEERTPSLLVVHSTSDKQVPFAGAPTRHLPEITQWVKDQATARHCESSSIPKNDTNATTSTWLGCVDDSFLRFVVLHNQSHGWLKIPQSSGGVMTTAQYIWKFFEDSVYYSGK